MKKKFKNLDSYDYIDNNIYKNLMQNKLSDIYLKYQVKKHNNNFILKEINRIDAYNLTEEQKKAVITLEDNVLLVSGAGCGKTHTIVSKIRYLIEEKNIDEREILCLSFTNKSVNDLKKKINYNVDIYTFHKLSLDILKDYNLSYSLVDDEYLKFIVNEILYKYDMIYLKKTIISFITLFIMNNLPFSYLERISKKDKLLRIIKEIYIIYVNEKYSSKELDFNDIINKSIEFIEEKGLKKYYKYIIIDEYQDISYQRFLLVKKIKDACNSKIFAVGDDFQIIYSFSGSNIKMLIDFKKMFGKTEILYLTKTYRNSVELVKLSNKFILKNKNQIKKRIISEKSLYRPIKIVYYDKNINLKIKKVFSKLSRSLILIRNNSDINVLIDKEIKITSDSVIYNNKEFKYLTVHKSKGLEEENVIILNLTSLNNGFPTKIKNDRILNYVQSKYNYLEEERRLFYVALTRTKNFVYLFVDKNNPSIFIKEILRESKNYIEVLDL